jgi:hypothetical protein
MQLLLLITWVINTTPTFALPKGNILYKIWFGRKPSTNFQDYKGNARYIYIVLGRENESSTSGELSIIKVTKGEENGEDKNSLFINQEAELEEAAEEMILSKLTKRVTEYIRK